jgi:trehalose/maltose transport system substrate-binding protein
MNRKFVTVSAAALMFAFVVPGSSLVSAKSTHGSINTSNCSTVPAQTKYPAAPKDPFAKQDKKYAGQTITYFGGSVGTDHDADVPLCIAFEKSTGIKVNLDLMSSDENAAETTLEDTFTSKSSAIDVTKLDVVWPGIFGQYLVPLSKPLATNIKLESKGILANDTYKGKLVAMPYQGDFGLLYYRKDLLSKYHLKVPTTWSQLDSEAKTIQAGEKPSNSSFSGFVFQENAYEGLTCNALEWIASYGGGNFINNKGSVTIDNSKAAAALTEIKSMIGTITPSDIDTYQEGATADAFDAGDAAFARNWPYMWATFPGSSVQGKVGVAPLPHGPNGKSSATVGGWELGVNKYSKHVGAAEAWTRYYTSAAVQQWRAVHAGIAPTMPSVAGKSAVKKANPALAVAAKTTDVTRPSTILAGNYSQGSQYIYEDTSEILSGSVSVSNGLAELKSQLKSITP